MNVLIVGHSASPLVVAAGYRLDQRIRGITLRFCDSTTLAADAMRRGALLAMVPENEVGDLLKEGEIWGRVTRSTLLLMRKKRERWGGRRGRRFRSFVRQLRVEQEVRGCHFFEDGGDGTS